MPGTVIMSSMLHEAPKNPVDMKSSAQWRSGYEHINTNGPSSNSENRASMWCDKERCDRNSPIFGWSRNIVMAALHNNAANKLLSQSVKEYPITLMDIKESLSGGIGKTPLAHALAMAFSAHYIRKDGTDMTPQFMTATCLDLFRGESGSRSIPYIFDDGSLATQGAE
eukprot:3719510-Amphidinium_carterae.1